MASQDQYTGASQQDEQPNPEGQESQNAGEEGLQSAGNQGSQYGTEEGSPYEEYGGEGSPNAGEGSQFAGNQGSRYPGEFGGEEESQFAGRWGSQYPGEFGGEEGSQYNDNMPEARDAISSILQGALGDVTGEGAVSSVLGSMLKDAADKADEDALEKKYGKQYVGPGKPTDMKICDKYFIKPGQFGSDLFPGTGEMPPNASLDEFKFPEDDSKARGGSLTSFLELIDKCSVEFPEQELQELDSDMELDAYDSEYIKSTVGIPLTLAFAEIVAKKPTDPIHFLGHWLYKWRYNQEAKQVEIDKINELIAEREAIAAAEREKQRLADEKIALQLIDNIMDDILDGRRRRPSGVDYEEEGEGQEPTWYGGNYGEGGEGWYPQQDYQNDQYGDNQYGPKDNREGSSPAVQGYEQFPPEDPNQSQYTQEQYPQGSQQYQPQDQQQY